MHPIAQYFFSAYALCALTAIWYRLRLLQEDAHTFELWASSHPENSSSMTAYEKELYDQNQRLQIWLRAQHGPEWRDRHEEWRQSQGLPDGLQIALKMEERR